MQPEQPREWHYIGRAGQRRRWRWLRGTGRALHQGLGRLRAVFLNLGRWLQNWLRGAVLGEGRRRRIGPAEALIWLVVAAVAGAFLLLLSQQMLALALVLALLGVAYALRELR